jgi:hypothetical protein
LRRFGMAVPLIEGLGMLTPSGSSSACSAVKYLFSCWWPQRRKARSTEVFCLTMFRVPPRARILSHNGRSTSIARSFSWPRSMRFIRIRTWVSWDSSHGSPV